MNVDGNGEADQASSKQPAGWQASPIIGVIVILVCLSSIVAAPMAAMAHHSSGPLRQTQQDAN